jgi:DtxR family Mn-dependent transcriptional regulator
VQVASVFERDWKLLEFLNNIGIHPGATLEVTARNYDDTLTLRIDDRPLVQLGRAVAGKVWVESTEVPSPG